MFTKSPSVKYVFAPIHKPRFAFSSWSVFGSKWSGRSEFLVGGDVGHEMIGAMGVVHAQGAGEDVAHNSNANFL